MKSLISTQEKGLRESKTNKKKISEQAGSKPSQEIPRNLLAVVNLDIGDGESDIIKVFQGDDII